MSRMMQTAAWVFAAFGLTGCVLTEGFHRPKEEMPAGSVYQVHATWESRVMVTQDVLNQGAPLAGVAGRMYLFGQELGAPVIGDGIAIVDLQDVTPETAQGKPKLLERWEIDQATLKRLARKDTIGWGYTLFLPWSTYRPEVTRVQLQVRYVPEKGLPLFSPPAVITLRNEAPVTTTTRQVVPGAPVQPAAAKVGASK
jgi:hypothetical protein